MFRTFALSLIGLATTLSAQTYSFSPAPDYRTREGAGRSAEFGAYPEFRCQIIDGGFDRKQQLIKGLALRDDYHMHTPPGKGGGEGRSWPAVRLQLARGSLGTPSATFAANTSSTPSLVFSGAVSWPDRNQRTWQSPGSWRHLMPFRSAFLVPPTDLVLDFKFSGGTLKNKASWTLPKPYALDSYGFGNRTMTPGMLITAGASTSNLRRCVDQSMPYYKPAAIELFFYQYGPYSTIPAQRNRWVLQAEGVSFAPNQPAVIALGRSLGRAGVAFPRLGCQDLFVDLSGPMLIYSLRADRVGRFNIPVLPASGAPRNAALEGQGFAMQGLWHDSSSGQLKMSMASHLQIPFVAMFSLASQVPREVIWARSASATQGSVIDAVTRNSYDLILRYAH